MRWLLLRGLVRERRHFEHFPDELAARVPGAVPVTADLCGFGDAMSTVSPISIGAIVDELRGRLRIVPDGDGPWGILAVSLGGMVALNWAARYPADFARVVVINTSAADLSPPWDRFKPSLTARLPALVAMDPVARERILIDITINRTDVDREALAQKWAQYYRERPPRKRSFLRQLAAAARSRVPKHVEAPVLVLTSTNDRLVSTRCSRRIAEALQARIEVHPTGGHDLTFDDAAWVCERVADFQR